MVKEIIDLYEDRYVLTNQTIQRGDVVPANQYGLIVFVCIFNKDGKMLIQQRQMTKKGWPGLWDVSVGGAVSSGESSLEAARREVKEELGIVLDHKDFIKVLSIYYDETIHDIYTVMADIDINEIELQEEEVMDAQYASLTEIKEMIHNQEFIPVHAPFIELLFLMKNKKGILKI